MALSKKEFTLGKVWEFFRFRKFFLSIVLEKQIVICFID
ncbi:hypothetical protein LEP1GSC040_1297 [Leptospira santarosai str. 2000030832]|nr:hypothetical protein LEP1GSC040_1297 [Leptospira santarosai str. 2000030832]